MSDSASRDRIPLGEALRVWAYIAINSFGGPAGQIAVMHRVLVDTRHWISERRFLHALNYCMLLPGPEAQQLAVYIGWLMHGTRGGLMAGALFVLPGFLAILGLSVIYAGYQDVTLVEAVFFGLKPAVLAIVMAAVLRVGRRSLTDPLLVRIAVVSFVAIFFFGVPFPVVVAVAGAVGYVGSRIAPSRFALSGGHRAAASPTTEVTRPILSDDDAMSVRPSTRRAVGVLLVGGALWLGPVALILAVLGPDHIYATQAVFFSGAAVVTFGGAYAVLTYVAQQAVETLGWLTPTEMIDGLAMAETTPGPLIMVVEFVGFLAAYREPGGLDPMVAGAVAAILVTWVTFAPSFLWVFLGAPYAEYLRGNARLTGTLSAITAAVVGAILNLALWFGLHALFGAVEEVSVGPATLYVPDVSTLDWAALLLTMGAFLAVLRFRMPILLVLAVSAIGGAFLFVVLGR